MSPEIIFFIATLCVGAVKTSVINIHVFDEESETKMEPQPVRYCNYRECEQRCRRLGFTDGACVDGRCKCANMLSAEYNVEEPASAESQSVRYCNYRACEQHCRRLGFTDGACVDGRCKCANMLSAENKVADESENAIPQSVLSCYYRECEQRCRRLGFTDGFCVDGRCKCDNSFNTKYRAEGAEMTKLRSSGSCYRKECIYRCRQQGFKGGICMKGRCKCNNYEGTENIAKDLYIANLEAETVYNEIISKLQKEHEDIVKALISDAALDSPAPEAGARAASANVIN